MTLRRAPGRGMALSFPLPAALDPSKDALCVERASCSVYGG